MRMSIPCYEKSRAVEIVEQPKELNEITPLPSYSQLVVMSPNVSVIMRDYVAY